MPDWKSYVRERLQITGVQGAQSIQMVEEIAQQLEDAYSEAIRNGASEQEAEQAAREHIPDWDHFGAELKQAAGSGPLIERMEARVHIRNGGGWRFAVVEFLRDMAHATRMFHRNPRFTIMVVLTMALGIGATTAIFSVISGILLHPLPYRNADRIVWVWGKFSQGERAAISPPDLKDYRAQSKSFETLAAMHIMHQWAPFALNLTGTQGTAIRLDGAIVTAGFFEAFSARPVMGRTFVASDEKEGAATAVISRQAWHDYFAGDSAVLGKSITLNGQPYTVVGVMEDGFHYPLQTEVWIPLAMDAPGMTERRFHSLRAIGLLREGTSVQQAQSEMSVIAGQLEKQHPESNHTWTVTLVPLQDQVVGDVRKPVWIIFSAVCVLLLIACANVAGLLLARTAARQKELAIRVALGAGRGRILRQMIAESVALTFPAAAIGLFLAQWSVVALKTTAPSFLPRLNEVTVDGWTLAFTAGCSVVSAILVSIIPALYMMPRAVSQRLKEGKYRTTEANRFRGALVIAEIALSIVLLAGAGLLLKSFWRVINVDSGFDSENLLTVGLSLEGKKYEDPEYCITFLDTALEKLRSLPGVESAAAGTGLPLVSAGGDLFFTIDGRPLPKSDAEKPNAQYRVITRSYFSTLKIPVLGGRSFTSADNAKSAPGIIINDALAREFFPKTDPVGKTVVIDGFTPLRVTVIGVVGDSRQELTDLPIPEMYMLYDRDPVQYFHLAIRTSPGIANQAGAVRAVLQQLDKDLTYPKFRTMQEIIAQDSLRRKLQAILLAVAAAIALLLAAIGIYGILSYSVEQRQQEIGIRMALGARPVSIQAMILRQGMRLVILGLGLGIAGAFALTRLLTTLLYEVSPQDPSILTLVSLLMLLVAVIACWSPARRATTTDPLQTLKYE